MKQLNIAKRMLRKKNAIVIMLVRMNMNNSCIGLSN